MSDLTPHTAVPRLFRSPISIIARAVELLESLGDSPDKVAHTLLKAGIKGVRGECGHCPVTNYLLRSDLNPSGVTTADREQEAALHFGPDYVVYVDLPEPVYTFAVRFDAGWYPQLVAGGAA